MFPLTLVPAQIASVLPSGSCSSALPFIEEFGHISTMPLNSKGPATGRRTARLEWQNRCWSDHKRGNGPGKAVCVADQGRITSEFGHGALLGACNIRNYVLVFAMLLRNPLPCMAWTCVPVLVLPTPSLPS